MRKFLANTMDRLLRPLGLACRSQKELHRQEALQRALIALANAHGSPAPLRPDGPLATGIVFSKDRACQLHALLESFFEQVTGEVPLHVLFTATSERHRRAYDEVREKFSAKPVHWIVEKNFRADLLATLATVATPRVFFLVDDIVITRPVDFARLAPFAPGQRVVSLRLGEHITRHHQEPMPPPPLQASRVDGEFVEWDWDAGPLSWAYPLSVDGHFFGADEMRVMAGHVEFSAPNSFEKALQLFRPVFARRRGVCFRQSRLVNLPINMVQTERVNLHGDVQPEFLLEQWEAGKKIDLTNLRGWTNQALHQEQPLRFVPR